MNNFFEQAYNLAAGHQSPEAGEYYAYVSQTTRLIVKRYRGEAEIQEQRMHMKTFIGKFPAKDLADARRIAGELRGDKS